MLQLGQVTVRKPPIKSNVKPQNINEKKKKKKQITHNKNEKKNQLKIPIS